FEALARTVLAGVPAGLGLLLDSSDSPAHPGLQQGIKQRPAVLEAAIEAALGHAQSGRQHFDADGINSSPRKLGKASLDPPCHSLVDGHVRSLDCDTVAYCPARGHVIRHRIKRPTTFPRL